MATINYRDADGQYKVLNVSDDFAREFKRMNKKERRRQWLDHKHGDVSLEMLFEKGIDIADPKNCDPYLKLFEPVKQDFNFLDCLTDYQHKVAVMRFNEHMGQDVIAKELGISQQAVSCLLKKISKKIAQAYSDD